MRKYSKLVNLNPLFLSVSILIAIVSCSTDYDANQNREYSLYSQLMCPVCEGQTIGESKASIAEDMKEMISNKIAEGQTDLEILNYFEDRYGTEILANPPKEGFNLIVWILPILGIICAMFLLVYNLNKSMKKIKK